MLRSGVAWTGKKENLADKVRKGEQKAAAASGLSQQQDAQEFLTYLLDQAHEELKRLPTLYPDISTAPEGNISISPALRRSWTSCKPPLIPFWI